MKKRSTIKVEDIKNSINSRLLHSPDKDMNARKHLISLINDVLLSTGNYQGFRYLDVEDIQKSRGGTTIGILSIDKHSNRFEGTDHTRVEYF